MESLYFGAAAWQGNQGAGSGPWVGADLECGMYYGGGNATKINKHNQPLPHEFVSLYLRGRVDGFALKGANAQAGAFTVMYDGPRPDCAIAGTCHRHGNHTYQVRAPARARAPRKHCALLTPLLPLGPIKPQPMNKKGAIILGTGGDSSDGAAGRFCEFAARPPLFPRTTPLFTFLRRPPDEGIMVTGATTDDTDDAVQANIVAVGYKTM